jgi:hypothetical protein
MAISLAFHKMNVSKRIAMLVATCSAIILVMLTRHMFDLYSYTANTRVVFHHI